MTIICGMTLVNKSEFEIIKNLEKHSQEAMGMNKNIKLLFAYHDHS